jgi:SAM-dependent methyltransferase
MIAQQFALPRGVLGRIVGTVMARANAALTRRVVGALRLKGDETVLEVGPGPGTGLALLASLLPTGRVHGAEPSPVMRAQAASRTRRFADRVDLIDATADTLPLPPGSCDAVCAVNNVQLWQPLPESLARVFDVLIPGGALALGVTERAVLPGGGSVGRTYDSLLVPDLERAGFVDLAATWERGGNGHELLITARRPAA